jgi:cell wall-associated NlpC family hydrolase
MAAATSYLSSAGADASTVGTVGTVDTIEYTVYDIEGVGAVDVSDYDALSRAIQIAYSDLPEWRQQVLAYAYASLGGEYVWGGEEFKACDCSGLTMLAYGSAGISLPHYSGSQSAFCNKSLSQAVPGDVCWKSGHVGIYIGNGATIEAMGPSYGITYGQLSSFTSCGNPVE